MKKIILIGTLILIAVLAGCANTEKYGDAQIVMKRNLMKAMTYSLNSPKFCIGEKKEYLFEYKDLPMPALPSNLIVVRHQWPNPDKGKENPSYTETKCQVSFEEPNGTPFFSTIVSLDAPTSRLYEPGKHPDPRQTYNVRVTVLEASSRKRDKVYLHSFSIGKNGLY